ncbi:macrophage mannose receptor 1-like [Misgurnus anguillicaudatus]|uniref:macrophage mannose receptor 1-like n=1 Tax=Misgurnus anguillicaudatus TaxID=75329 RepID=UPI003CCF73F7
MERLIQFLLFSGFWIFIQSNSNKFVLIQENKTWADAQVYCKKYHIDLATIASNEDKTSVRVAVSAAMPPLAWTGLYRYNNSWGLTYNLKIVTFLLWKSGKPENPSGREDCAVINGSSGWEDIACNQLFPFFCYNVSIADKFVFIPEIKSWYDAWDYCLQYHTDLAMIRNQTENDLLVNMMVGYEKAWFGLFKDTWRWSDGTKVNKFPVTWSAGQPNITGLNPLCGATTLDGADDRLCPETLPFICLRYTKNQIMRVELKSSQNLNDPAVMERILQLIKKKLKDRGIGNDTTLTWRVQPDGNVFSSKHDGEENQESCTITFL